MLPSTPLLCCGVRRGLERPGLDDFKLLHALTRTLIGSEVAAASTLAAVDKIHPGAILMSVESGTPDGILAVLPLRQTGREALLAGRFDGLSPDLDMIARPAERPAAVYAWGCAARTRTAARAVMATSAALPDEAFPGVNFFARAATADGLRALTVSLGYAPVGDSGLLRRVSAFRRAA